MADEGVKENKKQLFKLKLPHFFTYPKCEHSW